MTAEREALRMGIEHLTFLCPTEVSSFDFQVECTDSTVQYKLNAQSLRLFGLHRDVNDAHRAGANRLLNKQTNITDMPWLCKTWQLNGSKVIQARPNQLRSRRGSLRKFIHPEENPTPISTDNSLGFVKAFEQLKWNHEISTPCTTTETRNFVSIG